MPGINLVIGRRLDEDGAVAVDKENFHRRLKQIKWISQLRPLTRAAWEPR
jgi:histidinol phosphatase-like enzyme